MRISLPVSHYMDTVLSVTGTRRQVVILRVSGLTVVNKGQNSDTGCHLLKKLSSNLLNTAKEGPFSHLSMIPNCKYMVVYTYNLILSLSICILVISSGSARRLLNSNIKKRLLPRVKT